LPSFHHPLIKQARPFQNAISHSSGVYAQDSARAPPLT
jgi:hypothetical protein